MIWDRWIQQHIPSARLSGAQNWRITCPSCGRDKCYVTRGGGVPHCFRCKWSTRPILFITRILRCDLDQAREQLEGIYQGKRVATHTPVHHIRTPEALEFPDGSAHVSMGTGPVVEMAYKHLTDPIPSGRGLTDYELYLYGIRACWAGEFGYRIIVPWVLNGALVFWSARSFVPATRGPKYLYPRAVTHGRSEILFGLDFTSYGGTVIIVEGVFDAVPIGPGAVAVGGLTISPRQIQLLRERGFTRVIICLDPEAYAEALGMWSVLSAYPWEVAIARLPPGTDPGDCPRDQRDHALEHPHHPTWAEALLHAA